MSKQPAPESVTRLLNIMQQLRDPQTGCPWDRKQSFETIAPYTVEEAYEVADAIARHDMQDLCEELGDLLLQVVYHAHMAAEIDQFSFTDVVESICSKMVRRHPHVFAEENEDDRRDLVADWERIKTEERMLKGADTDDHSALAQVAAGLPPLLRALKLQKKAARVGLDWSAAAPVIKKIREELDELAQALQAEESRDRLTEEIGDLLFSVVNFSRHVNIDAGLALQQANAKFEARFRAIEVLASEQQRRLSDLNAAELNVLWEQVKRKL